MIVTSIHKNIQGVYVCSKQIQGEKYPDAHFKKSVKQIEKHITSNYNQSKHKNMEISWISRENILDITVYVLLTVYTQNSRRGGAINIPLSLFQN